VGKKQSGLKRFWLKKDVDEFSPKVILKDFEGNILDVDSIYIEIRR